MGQGIVAWMGCALALACSGTSSHNPSGNPEAGGAGVGGVVSSNGGQASNIAGSAGGGGGSAALGGASGGGTGGANLAGVPNLAGAPGCPPPTAKPANPATCPTNPDRQAPCNVDSALVCTYWEPTQLLCPQSGLFPTYLACCDHQWQTQPTLASSCASSAGGDSAGGAAP